MNTALDRYLDKVIEIADLRDPAKEERVREELYDHLREKISDLKTEGYSEHEAILKAMEDHGKPIIIGYRLRPWRFIDVRARGTARGFIAIGPKARGVVAIGGIAVGIFAVGGVSAGLVSFGGLALGMLFAWGGAAIGGLVYGGLACGVVACGGMAVGVVAAGQTAAGLWVPGAWETLWTHYSWETVPKMLHGLGKFLSYGTRSGRTAQEFFQMQGIISMILCVPMAIAIGFQVILLKREHKRLEEIEPSIVE